MAGTNMSGRATTVTGSDKPTTSNTQAYELSAQVLSGIAFFAALDSYGSKDVAMAFALCYEAALYWRYFAEPEAKRKGEQAKPRGHNSQQHAKALAKGRSSEPFQRPTPTQSADSSRKRQSTSISSQLEKKQKTRAAPEFNPANNLHANMAVLIRTEPDGVGNWQKCWSLGRIIRIISSRKTIHVTWLRPNEGADLPTERIFSQKWVPWTFKAGNQSKEWTSNGISMQSVQYGLMYPKSGKFSAKDQETLAVEVRRLEEAVRRETEAENTARNKAQRQNPQTLRKTPQIGI